MCKLHSEGLGTKVKSADVFTEEDEQLLWRSGILSLKDPKSLQNAAFYTVGKMFCLRGGVEHRALKLSQFKRMTDPDRYTYYENVSKNHNGSFKNLHVKHKVVPLYACPEAGDRCPVRILDEYISKLPQDALAKDLFYVRPLEKLPSSLSAPWYSSVLIGKHTLNQKVKNMCLQAGVSGNKTNHSLRATGATQMYEKGAPEKLIQERTGHRSLEALRAYERTSANQHRAVSHLLSTSTNTHYAEEVHRIQNGRTNVPMQQHAAQFPVSGFTFQNLHGCTININSSTAPSSTMSSITEVARQSVVELSETEEQHWTCEQS